jgi:hypothetical protein
MKTLQGVTKIPKPVLDWSQRKASKASSFGEGQTYALAVAMKARRVGTTSHWFLKRNICSKFLLKCVRLRRLLRSPRDE